MSKKRCNELDGRTWLQYSISVWDDIKKNKEELRLNHPAMFPISLVERLLRCYTTREEKIVLDPFLGSGSTVIAAKNLGKVGIGFEVCEEFVKLAERRLSELPFEDLESQVKIYHEDARNLLKYVKQDSVDICITSPPYWDILKQKRTADYKEIRHYGDEKENLENIKEYEEFLVELKKVFEKVYQVLKPAKYCIVVVMDIRKKDKFYPYHMDITSLMQDIGFSLDDIIVWNRKNDYSNLRPLGYPFRFRINKIHEYILIFRMPKNKK